MPFETFQRAHSRTTGPTVTLQRRGVIALNDAAWRLLGAPDTVTLLWDADDRTVGLRPGGGLSGYKVRPQNDRPNTARLVSASRFYAHIGHDHATALRCPAVMHDGGILGARLADGIFTTSNRDTTVRLT